MTKNDAQVGFPPVAGWGMIGAWTSSLTPHETQLWFPKRFDGSGMPWLAHWTRSTGAMTVPSKTRTWKVLAPAGGTSYNGQGYFNSGFMPGTLDQTPGPRSYSLTFTTPGTYEFICTLHYELGMGGQVTVLAATGTPGMPSTGEGSGWVLLAFVVFGLALVLGGMGMRRREAGKRS